VRTPVSRSTRLPRKVNFHGKAAEKAGERMMKIADSVNAGAPGAFTP
jgi:hypothetical protein